jgi:hypothetical protein
VIIAYGELTELTRRWIWILYANSKSAKLDRKRRQNLIQ